MPIGGHRFEAPACAQRSELHDPQCDRFAIEYRGVGRHRVRQDNSDQLRDQYAPEHRLLIYEDTAGIQCAAENAVSPFHRHGTAQHSPPQAWNTDQPDSITTIHANSASSVLRRLEQLASLQPMRQEIGEAVDLMISIERTRRAEGVRK
jgi:hypothetical protein